MREFVDTGSFWPLVLAPVLWGLLYYWHRGSIAPLSGWRKGLSLGLRSLLLLLVALAMCEPRVAFPTWREHVIWLIDVSHSMGENACEKLPELLKSHEWKGGKPDRQSWMAFGKNVVQIPSTTPPSADQLGQLQVQRDATRLTHALSMAQASFPPGYSKRIILVSDGADTTSNAHEQSSYQAISASLHSAGIRVDFLPYEQAQLPEVLVEDLRVSQQTSENTPVEINVSIRASEEGPATLNLFQNGVRFASREVTLKQGLNSFTTSHLPQGQQRLITYTAEVHARQDTLTQNNHYTQISLRKGHPKVLILTDDTRTARPLTWALKTQGIELDARPVEAAPTTLYELQNYDCLILDNVPATSLTMSQQRLIASYTQDFGGGLLMLGGDQSFGMGGYAQSPIGEVLPVKSQFEKEEEKPSLAISLVIDRSGSMGGIKMEMAKDAALAALELLSPSDFISVIAFDSTPLIVVPLQPVSDTNAIEDKIKRIQPSGGTNISPAMSEAYDQLSTNGAKIKHVILLTDGMSAPGPFYELTTRMNQELITVSTVAVGNGSDVNLLRQISQWGNGRFYFTNDPHNIPQIFAKETMAASRSGIEEYPFSVYPLRPAEFLGGINWKEAPYLLGHARTTLKPTADAWLGSENGEIILATWRHGLGQVAAFTSDARNRWASEWLQWKGFGIFWGQLIRTLMRTEKDMNSSLELIKEGDSCRIRFTTLDGNDSFQSEGSASATMISPDGERLETPLELVEPGVWEASVPREKEGIYSIKAALQKDGHILNSSTGALTWGYPKEFRYRHRNEPLEALASLVDATGGEIIDDSRQLQRQSRYVKSMLDLWPWLLSLAAFILVADVAARRLRFSQNQDPSTRKMR